MELGRSHYYRQGIAGNGIVSLEVSSLGFFVER